MNTTTQQAPQQRRITVIPADPDLAEKDIRKKHLRVAPYCRVCPYTRIDGQKKQ